MRRADGRGRAKRKETLIINTITGVTIGTIIGSFIAISPITSSYFFSSAKAEANVSVAQFKDLLKYSFKYADFQNVKLDSRANREEAEFFNEWLLGHKELNYKIEKGYFITYEEKETEVYPTDKIIIPEKIINPKSIKIYAGNDLKISSPVVYFNIEGDIRNYIEPVNPVYYKKDGNVDINKTDININFDFTKFVKDCNSKINNITGTITIGYLNSYKYEKIPVEFTRQYLLYEFGRELFEKLNSNESNGNEFYKEASNTGENTSKSIIGSYYRVNDNQKQMIDMISPELMEEIETLISSHNDLIKKYNDLLTEKSNLQKELEGIKNENSKLNEVKKGNEKNIEDLNTQINLLNSQIDKLKSSITTSEPEATGQQDNKDRKGGTQETPFSGQQEKTEIPPKI